MIDGPGSSMILGPRGHRTAGIFTLIVVVQIACAAFGETVGSPKAPIPDESARKRAAEIIGEIFQGKLDGAKSVADKTKLAEEMLQLAASTRDDLAAKFELLRLSRQQAIEVGSAELIGRVAELTAKVFAVDGPKLRASALVAATREPHSAQVFRQLTKDVLAFLNDTMGQERFDLAGPLADAAVASARKSRDEKLRREVAEIKKNIEAKKGIYQQVQQARKTLAQEPKEPDANLLVGKYLCLTVGKWKQGLPMLAAGSDTRLKDVASKELKYPAAPESQVEIAGLWWDLADDADSKSDRRVMLARAGGWYADALPKLAGLEKIRTQKKLAALEKQSIDPAEAFPERPPRNKKFLIVMSGSEADTTRKACALHKYEFDEAKGETIRGFRAERAMCFSRCAGAWAPALGQTPC